MNICGSIYSLKSKLNNRNKAFRRPISFLFKKRLPSKFINQSQPLSVLCSSKSRLYFVTQSSPVLFSEDISKKVSIHEEIQDVPPSTNNSNVEKAATIDKSYSEGSSNANTSSFVGTNEYQGSSASSMAILSFREAAAQHLRYLNSMTVRGYSVVKISLLFGIGISILLYIFGDDLMSLLFRKSANVASATLSDHEVKKNAQLFTKGLVSEILQDPQTTNNAIEFLVNLSKDEATSAAIVKIILESLKSPEVEETSHLLFKNLIMSFYLDPKSQQRTLEFVQFLLKQEKTKESFSLLVQKILREQVVRDGSKDIIMNLAKDDHTRLAVTELLTWSVLGLMKDDVVQIKSKEFLQSLLRDKQLHKEAGDALYQTIKNSIVPTYFSSPSIVVNSPSSSFASNSQKR